MFKRSLVLLLMLPLVGSSSLAADPDDLSQALLQRRCEACDLRAADLVHADLAGAQSRKGSASEGQLEPGDFGWC